MTSIESLKNNKFKSGIKLLIILLIFVMYLVFSYFWSVKSEVYAFDFLPADTNFYYEWTNRDSFDLKLKKNVELLDLNTPHNHLVDLQAFLGNKFVDVQEVVWFNTKNSEEDYYLIRFRSISDKFVEGLQTSQSQYKLRKASDAVLLIYQDKDLVLPELVNTRFSTNHTREGHNVYWQIDNEPSFLVNISQNIKSFVNFDDVHLNIKENSLNLFQIYNEEQQVEDNFSNMLFPGDSDLLLALGASSTKSIENYVANNIIMSNFNNLPYFNLTQDKFNDYFLRDSMLWQKDDKWLLASKTDWWPLITDIASSLELEEKKNVLPDGTAYTELVVKENQLTQHFEYMGHDLWQIADLFGMNIDDNFYLSNNRQSLEKLLSQKFSLKDFGNLCMSNNNYKILDFLWWDSNKLNNQALKNYLLSKDIDNLKIFSYQNSVIRGINWCL